jgi:hypothetical protein
LKPAVASNDMAFWIGKDGIGEAECLDRCFELIDLALWMGAGIAWIGNEVAQSAIGDSKP